MCFNGAYYNESSNYSKCHKNEHVAPEYICLVGIPALHMTLLSQSWSETAAEPEVRLSQNDEINYGAESDFYVLNVQGPKDLFVINFAK